MVKDKQKVVGIAPWYIQRGKIGPFVERALRFLGTPEGGSDFLDVLTLKGYEERVAQTIYKFLYQKAGNKWDVTNFQDVNSESRFFLNFISTHEREGRYYEIRRGSYCPRIDLPERVEDYLEVLSRNRRQQFKRHLRILQDGDGMEQFTYKKIDKISLLHDFILLYQKRWGEINPSFPDFVDTVFRRLSEKGRAQLDLLKKDRRIVAGILHLNQGKKRDYYMMAADRSFSDRLSIGNVIIGLSIMNAIKDGCITYDFLKGDEDYKFSWSNGGTQLLAYRFFRKTPVGLLHVSIDAFKKIGKALLR